MLEAMFEIPALGRAVAAGAMIGFLASFYGVFVVQRRLSFLGNGLAHSAFGGAALGILLGVEPFLLAVPFAVATALGVVWAREKSKIASDTAIGIFFSVSMALGILFLSMRRGYSGDAFAYLFGSILGVSKTDLWATGGVLLLTLALFPMWGRWAYAAFDRELAEADRVPVARDDCVLFSALALAVVVSAKVVGVVLIAACLVIPAAAARLVAPTFARMAIIAAIIGVLSVLAGLWLSYHYDAPSGPMIALTQAAVFFLAIPIGKKLGNL